jgi:hypothetical protein
MKTRAGRYDLVVEIGEDFEQTFVRVDTGDRQVLSTLVVGDLIWYEHNSEGPRFWPVYEIASTWPGPTPPVLGDPVVYAVRLGSGTLWEPDFEALGSKEVYVANLLQWDDWTGAMTGPDDGVGPSVIPLPLAYDPDVPSVTIKLDWAWCNAIQWGIDYGGFGPNGATYRYDIIGKFDGKYERTVQGTIHFVRSTAAGAVASDYLQGATP